MECPPRAFCESCGHVVRPRLEAGEATCPVCQRHLGGSLVAQPVVGSYSHAQKPRAPPSVLGNELRQTVDERAYRDALQATRAQLAAAGHTRVSAPIARAAVGRVVDEAPSWEGGTEAERAERVLMATHGIDARAAGKGRAAADFLADARARYGKLAPTARISDGTWHVAVAALMALDQLAPPVSGRASDAATTLVLRYDLPLPTDTRAAILEVWKCSGGGVCRSRI